MAIDRKTAHIVISEFEKRQRQNGQKEIINRYNERWTAESLLESMSKNDLLEAMDYYFEINSEPRWNKFARLAGALLNAKRDRDADRKNRAEQRRIMKEVLSEFRG